VPLATYVLASLQNDTTVGYTLPSDSSSTFENCLSLQVAIYFEMVFSMMLNAFLLAFFYMQVASCHCPILYLLHILQPNNEYRALLFYEYAQHHEASCGCV